MLGFFAAFIAALTPAALKPETVAVRPGDGHRLVTVRDGYRVIELPRGQGERPQREHVFDDVPSFAAWLKRNAAPETAEVFASQPTGETGGSVVAISGPTWARDTVRCRLALDPGFARMLQALNKPVNQDAILNVLRGLVPRTGESGINMLSKLSAVSVKSSGEFSRKVDSAGGFRGKVVQNNVEHDVPVELVYVGPVYLRGGDVRIVLSLAVDFENPTKPPTFSLQWPEKEVQMLDGYFAEVDALKGLLGADWSVSLGSCVVETYQPSAGFAQPEPVKVRVEAPAPATETRRY